MPAGEKDLTEYFCRVCGLDNDATRNSHGVPNHVICECCGNESGIGDDHLRQVRELRGYWVAQGAPWYTPEFRPEGWDILEQMTNLPREWR